MDPTTLRDIMTPQPFTVNRNDCLDKVEALFEEHHIHHLPVVDNSGSLRGIISQTDFEGMKYGLSLFRMPNREEYNQVLFRATRVADVMTKDVVELSPYDTILKAYKIFKRNSFRAIPIVDKGHLVGILTPLDLLDHFMN